MNLNKKSGKLQMADTDGLGTINDSVALVDPALLDRALNPRPSDVKEDEIITGTVRLGEIAHARSGDKGNNANIGVIAYTKTGYDWLQCYLGSELVKGYFLGTCLGTVVRYELPRIGALNFVLHDTLGGGGSRSLRTDAQGKTFGRLILEMSVPKPSDLDSMTRR